MGKNDKYIDLSSEIIQEDEKINHSEVNTSHEVKVGDKDVNYWRSFRELHNDPEFIRAKNLEFDKDANKPLDEGAFTGLSRRKFLGLLAASAAFAAAGCSTYRDKGEIIPYNKKPEEIVEGNPNYYASTFIIGAMPVGVLVKTREGRPIKVDGNPEHPVSKGKIDARTQGSILNVYDPDRIQNPKFASDRSSFADISWQDVDNQVIGLLNKAASSRKEIAIVSNPATSPTFNKVLTEFQAKYPTAKVYTYDTSNMSNKNSAWFKCYGNKTYPTIKYEDAKIILALESDFLGNDGNKIENARRFAQNREVINGDSFNRLYAVEGNVSITGMNADYRVRLRTDAIEEFALCLIKELSGRLSGTFAMDAGASGSVSSYNLSQFSQKYNIDNKVITNLVNDLAKNPGASFVTAGDSFPESTHITVNLLNEVLGNRNLYILDNYEEELPAFISSDMGALVNSLNGNNVGVLIHLDVNPVYNLPGDFGYDDAMKKAQSVITFTLRDSETSASSNYVLPVNSDFESWGDYRTRIGFYSLQQPVISPLYNTRQKEGVILNWINGNAETYNNDIYSNYVKNNWQATIHSAIGARVKFNEYWFGALHDGFVMTNQQPAVLAPMNQGAFTGIQKRLTPSSTSIILFTSSPFMGADGSFANNGWLQEIPHPISRVVWDNYAAVSPNMAKSLGVDMNDLIDISINGKTLQLPVMVQPGMDDNVISTELGYGRTVGGTVGTDVGVNVYPVISKSPALSAFFYNNAVITKAAGTYELVSTQEHYPIDNPRYKDIQFKRLIIQEGTYNQYKKNPQSITEKQSFEGIPLEEYPSINPSINEPNPIVPGNTNKYYQGPTKWAMAIDLNKCIGCGECVAACDVENNIPVVGKEQVGRNREMTWLRIDRYYSGTPEAPSANFQPMLCQHCDFAPCENVCPVLATTHSDDGINGMTYNRCVGTRYCSNNCPYKVRRFNYFNFRNRFKDGYQEEPSFALAANPEVTVRSRGVMEKCTFCVQRIMKARQVAIQEGREVRGSDVTVACQDACSTNAIIFGNMNDKKDKLQAYREHPLAYYVLEPIKVKPNVTYIAKLRNIEETLEERH